ncbi:MAG: acyltransferase, partial [Burkholderiales bacterium]
ALHLTGREVLHFKLEPALMFPAMHSLVASGYTGVDVFFVISGFIMAHTTCRFDEADDRAGQAITFMRRRLLRIVPLYWIALLWTIKVPLARGQFGADYFFDFLFLPRMHPSGNIWPELVAGWTINYEMFFYAMFALAMAFGRHRYKVVLSVLIALAALGALARPASVPLVFYTSPLVLEFAMGIGVFFAVSRTAASPHLLLLIFLGGFAVLILDNGAVPRAMADGVPAALMVYAAAKARPVRQRPVLERIGDASYSIYLFHLAVLSLLNHAIKAWPFAQGPVWDVVGFTVAVAFATSAGLLVHALLERPLTRRLQSRDLRLA